MKALIKDNVGNSVLVDAKVKLLPWQEQGLSYTASGYGSRIPTQYMVRLNGTWRRVYCKVYSNIGTMFIGKKDNPKIVDIFDDY